MPFFRRRGGDGGYPMQKSRVLVVTMSSSAVSETLRSVSDTLAALDGMEGAITVVDDGTSQDRAAALKAAIAEQGPQPRVRLLEADAFRGAAGANVGVCAGLPEGQTPDYVWLLAPGARPEADALARLAAHLDAHPETAIVGGGLLGQDGAAAPSAFRFPSLMRELTGGAPVAIAAAASGAVDWVSLESMMLRRSAIDEIGLFDEAYPLCFEDVDLCRRARAAGWGVDHVGDSRVRLVRGGGRIEAIRQRMPGYWAQARLRYFLRHHGPLYAAGATVAHVAGGLWRRVRGARPQGDPPRFLRGLILHDAGFALRGIWRSLRSKRASAPAPDRAQARRP